MKTRILALLLLLAPLTAIASDEPPLPSPAPLVEPTPIAIVAMQQGARHLFNQMPDSKWVLVVPKIELAVVQPLAFVVPGHVLTFRQTAA